MSSEGELSFLATPAPNVPDTAIGSSSGTVDLTSVGSPASPRLTGIGPTPSSTSHSPLSPRRRSPCPVRNSGVALVNDACLEFLHIEIVAFLAAQPAPLQGLDPSICLSLKLERIGFRVGQKIAERQCLARPRFSSDLDKIKFVCKEFWSIVFKKPQVDNLRTNNRGTYVLTDSRFRWLLSIGGPEAKDLAIRYTYFPCGLIRGCLAALGVVCTVTADPSSLPACTFNVKLTAAPQAPS